MCGGCGRAPPWCPSPEWAAPAPAHPAECWACDEPPRCAAGVLGSRRRQVGAGAPPAAPQPHNNSVMAAWLTLAGGGRGPGHTRGHSHRPTQQHGRKPAAGAPPAAPQPSSLRLIAVPYLSESVKTNLRSFKSLRTRPASWHSATVAATLVKSRCASASRSRRRTRT